MCVRVFVSCVFFVLCSWYVVHIVFCFQAEDGIRDLVRSRGLGDVYKRQAAEYFRDEEGKDILFFVDNIYRHVQAMTELSTNLCLLYTSDAADERSSVDLGGRRIIKKKKQRRRRRSSQHKK